MDLTYHALTGILVSRAFTGEWNNTPVIVASMMPDIIGVTPYYLYKIKRAVSKKTPVFKVFQPTAHENFDNNLDKNAYYVTHSGLGIFAFSIAMYFLYPSLFLETSLAYALHVAIDIPTHNDEWAFQPFYPLSKLKIQGSNWWKNKKASLFLWILLTISGLIVWLLE